MTRIRPWTPERKAMARQHIAEGISRKESLPLLNALPGDPLSMASLHNHLYNHGLKLTPEARLAVARRSGSSIVLRKGAPLCMTPERLAYFREAWPRGDEPDAVWCALSAMDGPPIKSPRALYQHAKNNGIKRDRAEKPPHDPIAARERILARRRAAHAKKQAARRPADVDRPRAPVMAPRRRVEPAVIAEPEPTIEPTPAIADAVTEERYAKVRAALSKRKSDPSDIARAHGMPLREVYRVAMDLRREARA